MTKDKQSVIKYMEECEKKGQFDIHTTPPPMELARPVDEHYDYLRRGIKHFFPSLFVNIFSFFKEREIIHDLFHLTVEGEENLNNIPNSVVVCNHVHMFDCVIVRHAFHRKHLYITAAEFNNRGDFLGFLMRYLGMMPISSNHQAMKHMNNAIKTILTEKEGHILFYPEASEWWYYKKPRPFKAGAFHYAADHHVPVQPMFITFKDTGRTDKEGNPTPDATLHILPAIYPDESLSRRDRIQALSDQSYQSMKDAYEKAYGIPLTYTCDQTKQQA